MKLTTLRYSNARYKEGVCHKPHHPKITAQKHLSAQSDELITFTISTFLHKLAKPAVRGHLLALKVPHQKTIRSYKSTHNITISERAKHLFNSQSTLNVSHQCVRNPYLARLWLIRQRVRNPVTCS